MTEKLNKDLENLRKKNQTQIMEIKVLFNQTKNTVEGHSSRLEQVEDRISGFRDETDVKEDKTQNSESEIKSCEKNMQECNDSIKRPHLTIMGIKEREEEKPKGYVLYSTK
jgi:chromosome segregation ATPase